MHLELCAPRRSSRTFLSPSSQLQ
uniref:Uncharacterized protein n=1 Tax=Arundo donax TaxID=35708 RepID=A0A0A9GU74_ARUDO